MKTTPAGVFSGVVASIPSSVAPPILRREEGIAVGGDARPWSAGSGDH